MELKSLGAHSAQMLSAKLGITTMGVRQHLQILESQELVEYHEVREKVGRPTRYWSLTQKGHARFANKHDELSIILISAIKKDFGENGLKKILQNREEQMVERYNAHISPAASPTERLQAFVEQRQQDGYMAELHEQEKGWLLVENHCPINAAAQHCSLLCTMEIPFFKRLLGEYYTIQRVAHLFSNDRHCAYLIQPKEK